MIASTWIAPRLLEILNRVFAGAEARLFVDILAGGAQMGPLTIEALAVYAYNRQAVPQEIVHPGGQVEYRELLQADFLTSDTTRIQVPGCCVVPARWRTNSSALKANRRVAGRACSVFCAGMRSKRSFGQCVTCTMTDFRGGRCKLSGTGICNSR